jgi:hypothetical protein
MKPQWGAWVAPIVHRQPTPTIRADLDCCRGTWLKVPRPNAHRRGVDGRLRPLRLGVNLSPRPAARVEDAHNYGVAKRAAASLRWRILFPAAYADDPNDVVLKASSFVVADLDHRQGASASAKGQVQLRRLLWIRRVGAAPPGVRTLGPPNCSIECLQASLARHWKGPDTDASTESSGAEPCRSLCWSSMTMPQSWRSWTCS